MMFIDTHCHLGGCLSPEFVWKAIGITGQSYLAENIQDVKNSMLFGQNEEHSFDRFLSKFSIINKIIWTPALLEMAIADALVQLNKNDYTLLSVSIEKYLNIGWHKRECVRFISDCFKKLAPGKVGLLLGLKYEYTKTMIKQHANLIDDADIYDVFAGIDFIGNERMIDSTHIDQVVSQWKDKIIRLHVGETSTSDFIQNIVQLPYVNRLAHAITADGQCRSYLRDNGIAIDMSLSSNFFTGTCTNFNNHPIIPFMQEGLEVTIGSDDPIQFDTDIENEYKIATKLDLDVDILKQNAMRLLPNQIESVKVRPSAEQARPNMI